MECCLLFGRSYNLHPLYVKVVSWNCCADTIVKRWMSLIVQPLACVLGNEAENGITNDGLNDVRTWVWHREHHNWRRSQCRLLSKLVAYSFWFCLAIYSFCCKTTKSNWKDGPVHFQESFQHQDMTVSKITMTENPKPWLWLICGV